jgi:hypothetical protein
MEPRRYASETAALADGAAPRTPGDGYTACAVLGHPARPWDPRDTPTTCVCGTRHRGPVQPYRDLPPQEPRDLRALYPPAA